MKGLRDILMYIHVELLGQNVKAVKRIQNYVRECQDAGTM
jgi:hypothetical protein